MILLDLTLPTPAENLALDEALLRKCAETGEEFLRFWESPSPFVVLGVSGKLRREVRAEACARDGVPILRRASGGGTVLQGPGCLAYALVLSLRFRPELADLRKSYAAILERIRDALRVPDLRVRGTSDLAVGEMKVSGSAQKRTASALLHHGTILYAFDVEAVERWIEEPERQPEYRRRRPHRAFLGNLALPPAEIRRRIAEAWGAVPQAWSAPDLGALVAETYADPAWTERF